MKQTPFIKRWSEANMFTFISLIFVESATIFKYQLVIYPHWKTNNFAPENWWLEDEMSFGGKRPIFRCELLVSGREIYTASWWFFTNPFEKYGRKIGSSSPYRGENTKYLKPPPIVSVRISKFNLNPRRQKSTRITIVQKMVGLMTPRIQTYPDRVGFMI